MLGHGLPKKKPGKKSSSVRKPITRLRLPPGEETPSPYPGLSLSETRRYKILSHNFRILNARQKLEWNELLEIFIRADKRENPEHYKK